MPVEQDGLGPQDEHDVVRVRAGANPRRSNQSINQINIKCSVKILCK